MNNLVIGNGQIGKPLAEILEFGHPVFIRDMEEIPDLPTIDIVHICFPYSDEFAGQVIQYLKKYEPYLCIVHSTVEPGTTDLIAQQVNMSVVYSPVKGRHGSMVEDLRRYTKFVAGHEPGRRAAIKLFEGVGLKVKPFPSARGLELAKLLETSYSGLLIAWAQEMARYCDSVGLDYFDLMPFLAEVDHLPGMVFQPGHIGGHCIMPNLILLEEVKKSPFVRAIRTSNERMAVGDGKRLFPIPMEEFL